MEVKKYHVFWEALIISLFIFALGIVLGVLMEDYRNQGIQLNYIHSETNLLDAQLFSQLLDERFNCTQIIEKNIKFGNEIYEDAQQISNYEAASQFGEEIDEMHKRYDVLRTIFWINSIKIKDRCGEDFHTLVYLYDYLPEDLSEKG